MSDLKVPTYKTGKTVGAGGAGLLDSGDGYVEAEKDKGRIAAAFAD
jgi:hypothetical protein